MPRRNRVTPFGEIVAIPERGTMMGNRGRLHDESGRVLRPWQVRRWLVCLLEFHGRHRQVMAPNRYTELFFLDEATALAAGHRPCFECRRKAFEAFALAWAEANEPDAGPGRPSAGSIDQRLHAERIGAGRAFEADLDDLPDGAFVTRPGAEGRACLLWRRRLLAWSPGGYFGRFRGPRAGRVEVLTPRSTIRAIRAGYVPGVHPSAEEA